MSEQLRIARLAHAAISVIPEELFDLGTYGDETKGCVASHLSRDPEFNKLGLYGSMIDCATGDGKTWYPKTDTFQDCAFKAIGEVFQDDQAYHKYCTMYGVGKWDHLLLKKGHTTSHKQLALLRLEYGIMSLENEK